MTTNQVSNNPSVNQVSAHVAMSKMISVEKFVELQKQRCLPMEVMLEPQAEWFTEEGCNYPVGAIQWAEDIVEGDITIYSTVFHQAYMSAGRRYDTSVQPGSSGFISAIAITVSKVNQSKEVRLEMTVGHDKVMIITKEKLVLKEKNSNKVFEVWYRIVRDGVKYWTITHALRGVIPEPDVASPPLYLTSFCQRMICFVQTQVTYSAEDLKKMKDGMNRQTSEIQTRHRISLIRKTPTALEQLYNVTVQNIYNLNKSNMDINLVNRLINKEFSAFLNKFNEFLDKDYGILLQNLEVSSCQDDCV